MRKFVTPPAPQRRPTLGAILLAFGTILGALASAADAPAPASPASGARAENAAVKRGASLPARGLFIGEELSPLARERLVDLIVDAVGQNVEVALVVPSGPWRIEDQGRDERSLTPARLQAVRRFLVERGIDPRQIFVESRIDATLSEPRLDVQLYTRPATD